MSSRVTAAARYLAASLCAALFWALVAQLSLDATGVDMIPAVYDPSRIEGSTLLVLVWLASFGLYAVVARLARSQR